MNNSTLSKRYFFTLLLSVVITSLFSLPGIVSASGNIAVTLANPDPTSSNKSWFFFEKTNDDPIRDSILVKNFGRETVSVQVYAADATSNEAGSFVLKYPKDGNKGLGAWTKINVSALQLGPGEFAEIPFEITLPENIAPGDYAGGIVVQERSQKDLGLENSSEASIGASVSTRVASRVYLKVPGQVQTSLSWDDFRHEVGVGGSKQYFVFDLNNKGNVSLEPVVELSYVNMFGREIGRTKHLLGISLPGSHIEPKIVWNDVPFLGRYTVQAELSYTRVEQGQLQKIGETQLTKQISVWIIPWLELTLFALFWIFVVIFLIFKSRQLEVIKSNCVEYVVSKGDNVKDLAKASGVSWRLIVKINDLQSPYVLDEGTKILIPKPKNAKK